jgi:transposase
MSYVIEQAVKGHIYLYSVDSYWDKDKKQPRQRRTYLGRKGEKGTLVPAANSLKDAKEFGNTFLLDKIAEQLGLTGILQSVFPNAWREILAVAFFKICENKALYLCDHWLDAVYLKEPISLPSPRMSEFLSQLGHTTAYREKFFQQWSQQCGKSDKFLVFDITSISSYANGIDFVEWGYNRDHEALPQINLGLVYGEPSALPLCYTVYPGSINDVTTLRNTVFKLESLGKEKTLFVLDKGFYSMTNLKSMRGMNFIIPLPVKTYAYREMVLSVKGIIRSAKYAIARQKQVYYCVQKTTIIGESAFFVHCYLDERRQTSEREAFLHSLLEAEAAVISHGFTTNAQIDSYLRDQVPDFYPYFMIKKRGKKSILIRRSDKIDEALESKGIFILITNTELSSETVLDYYRQRDGVEKHFDALKNNLYLKRLRIHGNQSMEGLLFIEFISMILRSRLQTGMRKVKLPSSLCVPEALFELRKLKQISFGKRNALTELSKTQKEIFSAFGIDLNSLSS